MSWEQLAVRLMTQSRRLDGTELDGLMFPLPVSDDDLTARAESRENPTRAKIDAAVRGFANGKPWPELSDDEQFFLELRLFYGEVLARSFELTDTPHRMKFVPNPQTEEEDRAALEWLLVDSWPSLGFLLWLVVECGRLSALQRPGAPPAAG